MFFIVETQAPILGPENYFWQASVVLRYSKGSVGSEIEFFVEGSGVQSYFPGIFKRLVAFPFGEQHSFFQFFHGVFLYVR